jgi:hypothetical protein
MISGEATPPRKVTAIYTGKATDPDGDQLSVMWALAPFPCTTDTGPDSWPPSKDWKTSVGDEATLVLDRDATDVPLCVWAFAIDSHGAKGADHLAVVPQDQAPIAQLAVVGPDAVKFAAGIGTYPLYSRIALSSKGSIDPEDDALMNQTWTFTLVPPGFTTTLDSCNGSDECSFVADKPGEYDIAFTTSDGTTTGKAPLKIIVNPDQAPCIGPSDPDFLMSPMVVVILPSPTNPMPDHPMPDPLPSFTIHSVADDGAPWPPGPKGGATFRWYVSTDGPQFQFFNNDYPTLPLASTGLYKTGDIVKVRVEVSDRNEANDAVLRGCDDKNDLCQAVPGCFQRVTWSVAFR